MLSLDAICAQHLQQAQQRGLPAPSAEGQQHLRAMLQSLQQRLADGAWLAFADYMQHVLYAPGLGYYSAGASKIGAEGDFITAPELGPLFAQCLARNLAQLLPQTGPAILELGPGRGALAAELLLALEQAGQLPDTYYLLDLSPDLQARQRQRLQAQVPHLLPRCQWLTQWPQNFNGVVLANEVLDAMPVHLLVWDAHGAVQERGVVWNEQGLAWADRPLNPAHAHLHAEALCLAPRGLALGEPYLSEVNAWLPGWFQAMAQSLQRGAALLFDYGFPEAEYYHPQRQSGTLMCHYRHHAHTDPLLLPGLQDLTAHVNFTAAAEAAWAAGLTLQGYTAQAQFLLNSGLTDILQAQGDPSSSAYIRAASNAQRLISPAEMGELFKVLAVSHNLPEGLPGFERGDRLHGLG